MGRQQLNCHHPVALNAKFRKVCRQILMHMVSVKKKPFNSCAYGRTMKLRREKMRTIFCSWDNVLLAEIKEKQKQVLMELQVVKDKYKELQLLVEYDKVLKDIQTGHQIWPKKHYDVICTKMIPVIQMATEIKLRYATEIKQCRDLDGKFYDLKLRQQEILRRKHWIAYVSYVGRYQAFLR